MYDFGFFLFIATVIFALILGSLILSRIRKNNDAEITFFFVLMLIALTQAAYYAPENIRILFLMGTFVFVVTLSALIARHYAKKEKRAAAYKYVAVAIITLALGIFVVFSSG